MLKMQVNLLDKTMLNTLKLIKYYVTHHELEKLAVPKWRHIFSLTFNIKFILLCCKKAFYSDEKINVYYTQEKFVTKVLVNDVEAN